MKSIQVLLKSMLPIVFLSCIILAAGKNEKGKKSTIGLVGKSKSNPVFIATYTGAKVAAQEIGKKMNVEVTIDWRTPETEDGHKQAAAIEKLARSGVAGIAVSCSNAKIVTPAINKAVELNVPVVTFDSDAPESKRFAYYSVNNEKFGEMMLDELAKQMKEKGVIAILGGNKSAPNLQLRIRKIIEGLKKYPSMKLMEDGVVYHEEIPEKAADVVNRVQLANPQIGGWAFVGAWPLFIKNAIKWEPDKVKIVACDASPTELEYLKSGHVQVLLAQNCFLWGYKSVEILLNKILLNQVPTNEFVEAPLTRVTKENLEEWSLNWKKWLVKDAVYR